MKRLNLLKPDRLLSLLHWIGWPAIGAYAVSMLVIPVFCSGLQWEQIQEVWDRWQGLNIGMLALIASVVAFDIARYKENKQREREFLAARAFLPASLSELCTYFKDSATVYKEAWDEADPHTRTARAAPPDAPQLPSSYKTVFADCIRHAEPEVGEFLANLLSELQVHDARLRRFVDPYQPMRLEIFSNLHEAGEMQAFVNKLFPFARGEDDFDSTPISWDDFHNAYKNIGIHVEDYELDLNDGTRHDLITYTKRSIARARGEQEPPYMDREATLDTAK